MTRKAPVALLVAAIASLIPLAGAASERSHATVDLRSFFQAHVGLSRTEVPSLKVPAIWVFRPDGAFVARLDSPEGVAGLGKIIGKSGHPSISAVRLPDVIGNLRNLGADVADQPGGWTAVLLTREPCEKLCPHARREIDKLASAASTAMNVIEVSLVLKP